MWNETKWNLYKIKNPNTVSIMTGMAVELTHINGHDISLRLSELDFNIDVADFFLTTLIHIHIDEEIKVDSLDSVKRRAIDENTNLGRNYSKYDRDESYYYKELPEGTFSLASINPEHQELNPIRKKYCADSIEEVLSFDCKDEIPSWYHRVMTAERPESEQ